jgi:zinc transporter ZupT
MDGTPAPGPSPLYQACYSRNLIPPPSSGIAATAAAAAVGMAGAWAGVWLTGAHRHARVVVPFSAGVLLGVVLLGLVPELAVEFGWSATLPLFAAGYLALLLVNRYVYPVCPTCSHDHDHKACAAELHGFAWPLIVAAALHSFMDGWSVVATGLSASAEVRVAVPLAVALHKIPEGIALGGILRAAVKSRGQALAWSLGAEAVTLAGGAAGLWMAPQIGARWTVYPVGITAGWLCYLGYHAVHEEWKRRGAAPAFLSAAAGIAGAVLIERGVEALLK